MFFRQFLETQSSTWTYLLADPESREAVIVDPVLDTVERDIRFLTDLGFTLRWSVETHVHADHVTAASVIRERTGCKTVVSANAGLTCVDREVRDADTIEFGRFALQVLETPGHTNCSVSYLTVGASPVRVFTGDALLIRGCGRTDFQQGSSTTLYEAVHRHLFSLPDETIVHPAHDYNGCTASTIGEEKRLNPRLTLPKADFVALMAALNLPRPKQIDVAVPANQHCGRLPG